MYATSAPTPNATHPNVEALAIYSRSLHDYTLRLWTESRRLAEEKAREKAARRKRMVEEDQCRRMEAAAVALQMQKAEEDSVVALREETAGGIAVMV